MNQEVEISAQFPVPFLSTTLDISDNTLLSYESFLKSQDYHHSYNPIPLTVDQHILERDIFKDLKSQILSTSLFYLNKIGFDVNSVEIITSWGVETISENNSHAHDHSNSFISGVFYLNEGPDLIFLDPNEKKWWIKSIGLRDDGLETFKWNNRQICCKPMPKLLIMFPSWMSHQVMCKNQTKKRFSIAFNIIPKGYFGELGNRIKF
jgi:uncharacterized protein (TIGR02466 family)